MVRPFERTLLPAAEGQPQPGYIPPRPSTSSFFANLATMGRQDSGSHWTRNRQAPLPMGALCCGAQDSSSTIVGAMSQMSLEEPREKLDSTKKNGSIRGLIRRASVSLRAKRPRRPSLTVEERPATSSSAWHKLRQATSFNRNSRLLPPQFDVEGPVDSCEELIAPIPGNGKAPPIIPRGSGGAAARATAAAQNEIYGRNRHLLLAEDQQGDRESGIGIALTTSEPLQYVDAADNLISRMDFVSKLPVELSIQILSHLDNQALLRASAVSRTWAKICATQHIWRESFLREKSKTYATSKAVEAGSGAGIPYAKPDNDWKDIYRVREELEHNWREGHAQPVYLNGHLDSIYCVQFDEDKIITGSRDKTIRVWDMKTYDCRLVIGPPDVVRDPAIMHDQNGKPRHYATLPTPQAEDAYQSVPSTVSFDMYHNASILCLQYDEEILVTGSSDSSCIVYDIKQGFKPIMRLQHHTAAVLDLAFDDRYIVTCSKDVSICVWDRHTGVMLKQLRAHIGPVNAVQMRGNTIVSCSGDFKVKLWNIDTGKNIREFAGHTKGLACSQFSDDSKYIASAGNDKIIRIWDANTGECLNKIGAHENLVRSLHIDSISGRLISGSYDQDIKVFDMASGRLLLDFPKWHTSWVLAAKSDYRRIISTGQDPKILIMDFGMNIKGIDLLESKA
ncbi:hypothetical protein BP6252_02117 [Coleophoma cylindrospora]|uniref:F-box domain-containing protein n=1 Tax=Coleophoma cylindrospora TaxID=1849047 RepID=A0A3D8SDV6_9HELO|nr:hypothetical protein BP6252_02117 [Coleophoma cylindrospora]